MHPEGSTNVESSQWHAEFARLLALNTERLKTVVDTTHEIKEQLVIMNGRVRKAETNIAVIEANPSSVTRDRCDEKRGELDGKRSKLEERVERLERKVPAIVQNLTMCLLTGGVMALVGYFLSRLPGP